MKKTLIALAMSGLAISSERSQPTTYQVRASYPKQRVKKDRFKYHGKK